MRAPYYLKLKIEEDASDIEVRCAGGIRYLAPVLAIEVGLAEIRQNRILKLIEEAKKTPFETPIEYNGDAFFLELEQEEVTFEFSDEEMAEERPGNSVPLEVFERAVKWWLRAVEGEIEQVGDAGHGGADGKATRTVVIDLNTDAIVPDDEYPEKD